MSRIDSGNVDATLSKAQPQNVVIQSQNSAVETVLSQLTGTKFAITHKQCLVKPCPNDTMTYIITVITVALTVRFDMSESLVVLTWGSKETPTSFNDSFVHSEDI